MRLKEERLIIFQGIISILILLVVIFIQIAESKISKYNHETSLKQNELNLQIGQMLNTTLETEFNNIKYVFSSLLGDKVYTVTMDSLKLKSFGSESLEEDLQFENDLDSLYQTKQITTADLYMKKAERFANIHVEACNRYNQMLQDYKDRSFTDKVWSTIKNILVVIELTLIIISLFVYLQIFKQIDSRLVNSPSSKGVRNV